MCNSICEVKAKPAKGQSAKRAGTLSSQGIRFTGRVLDNALASCYHRNKREHDIVVHTPRDRMSSPSDTAPLRSQEFEQLVLEHMDMMYAVALKLTRNAADAEDLVQNAVVKALRFHDKFKEGTYIKAWLLTILRNTFINDYRRKVRSPAMTELSGMEAAAEKSADPDIPIGVEYGDRTNLMELLDDEVRAALEAVPLDFRIPVIMADMEDKSYKEIADAMNCPLGTVMSRLYRGRKLLRDALQQYAKDRRYAVTP
jgi:RNA polymerase sigma-70 factor (ECF subfamily)